MSGTRIVVACVLALASVARGQTNPSPTTSQWPPAVRERIDRLAIRCARSAFHRVPCMRRRRKES